MNKILLLSLAMVLACCMVASGAISNANLDPSTTSKAGTSTHISRNVIEAANPYQMTPMLQNIPGNQPPLPRILDAPPNDLCENPQAIVAPYPVTITGTTLEATADCPDLLNWNAVWYTIDLPYAINNLSIDWCPTAASPDTMGVIIMPDCNCLTFTAANNTWQDCSNGTRQALLEFSRIPGPVTIYYPAYNFPASDFSFIVNVTEAPPCNVTCPVPNVAEVEPNSGCNEDPVIFNPLTVGQTICGSASFDGSIRDTDWYQFAITDTMRVTLTGTADFAYILGFIMPDPTLPCGYDTLITSAVQGNPCDSLTALAELVPGTYLVFAAPLFENAPFTDGVYWFSINAEPFTRPDYGLARTGNVPNVGVSNACALGENTAQGNTFSWGGRPAVDYAGTFVFGNSSSSVFWRYGSNIQMTPPLPLGALDTTDHFHPTASYLGNGALSGLTVNYCGKGFAGAASDSGDIFLHTFTMVNNGSTTISNLYGAAYFDWDVYTTRDSVFLDRADRLIYQKGAGNRPLYGLSLVNNVPLRSLCGISQQVYSYTFSGWLPDSMWSRISYDGDIIPYYYTDMGSLLSAGPFTLAPGASQVVVIAQIGATNAANMIARATLARSLANPCVPVSGCDYTPGDVNNNGSVNGVDIVFAVAYFKGGPNHPPVDCGGICPEASPFYAAGDVNGNCVFNGIDITFFVRYLKLLVPNLLTCADCPPAS